MARKGLIQREEKRKKLEEKYRLIRRSSKNALSKVPDKRKVYGKLQAPPRNSAPTRLRRRCFWTGRPRATYRDFGVSGYILRQMFEECLLPGATRSSW